uniref:Cilia- and flagella-associated protein 157 n=1 Tax=Panagrolaimus sp. JU765 TaxID=591449 RepID=A0AC34Q7B6_9BILA
MKNKEMEKQQLLQETGRSNLQLTQKVNFYIAELKKRDQQLKDLDDEKKSMMEEVLKEQEEKMNEIRLKYDFQMKMNIENHVREMDAVQDQLKKVEAEKQTKIEGLEKALMSSQDETRRLRNICRNFKEKLESSLEVIDGHRIQLDDYAAERATLLEQVSILQNVISEQENKIKEMNAEFARLESYNSTVEERDEELQDLNSELNSKIEELEGLKRDHSSVVCELQQVKTENTKLKKDLQMYNRHVNVFSNNLVTAYQPIPVSTPRPLLKSMLEPKPDELSKENQLLKSKIVAAQKLLDLSTFLPMMKNEMKSPEKVEGDFVDVVSEMNRLNVEQERDEFHFVV